MKEEFLKRKRQEQKQNQDSEEEEEESDSGDQTQPTAPPANPHDMLVRSLLQEVEHPGGMPPSASQSQSSAVARPRGRPSSASQQSSARVVEEGGRKAKAKQCARSAATAAQGRVVEPRRLRTGLSAPSVKPTLPATPSSQAKKRKVLPNPEPDPANQGGGDDFDVDDLPSK